MLKQAAMEGRPFRVVLLDGHMPGMDGFEVAARMKHEPSMKGAAVILLTSAGLGEDASRAKTVGAAAALTKPVKQSELWDAIVNALHLPGVAAQAVVPAIPAAVSYTKFTDQ